MSRSTAPRQDALDRWVDTQAVAAYANGLAAQSMQIDDHAWLDGPNRAEAQAMIALREAAEAVRAANEMAARAERLASAVYCAWLYGWDHEHPQSVFGSDAALRPRPGPVRQGPRLTPGEGTRP